jgi:sugar phosphate isomerase/epimerase
MTRIWSTAPADLTFCLPTLYPDLGNGTDTHLAAALSAAARAGFRGLDVFGSHVVQAIEAAAAGGERDALTVPANRRSAIGGFRAALQRWPEALARPEAVMIRDFFAGHGLQVLAVEVMSQWADGDTEIGRADARAVCRVAQFLGARYAVAVCLQPDMDIARGAAGLQMAASIAGEHGLQVCLEWLPGTGMPSMRIARTLIERSGASNIGYTLDILHWQCQPGGPDWRTLAEVAPGSVYLVQLSDCAYPLPPGVAEPTDRLLPGHGDIETVRLLQRMLELDMAPIMSVEVFDEKSLMASGMAEFARAQGDALREVLECSNPGAGT